MIFIDFGFHYAFAIRCTLLFPSDRLSWVQELAANIARDAPHNIATDRIEDSEAKEARSRYGKELTFDASKARLGELTKLLQYKGLLSALLSNQLQLLEVPLMQEKVLQSIESWVCSCQNRAGPQRLITQQTLLLESVYRLECCVFPASFAIFCFTHGRARRSEKQ